MGTALKGWGLALDDGDGVVYVMKLRMLIFSFLFYPWAGLEILSWA